MKLKTIRVKCTELSDEVVTSDKFMDKCVEIFGAMSEFIDMLNDVIEPDDDSSDEEEEEQEQEEGEEEEEEGDE